MFHYKNARMKELSNVINLANEHDRAQAIIASGPSGGKLNFSREQNLLLARADNAAKLSSVKDDNAGRGKLCSWQSLIYHWMDH